MKEACGSISPAAGGGLEDENDGPCRAPEPDQRLEWTNTTCINGVNGV